MSRIYDALKRLEADRQRQLSHSDWPPRRHCERAATCVLNGGHEDGCLDGDAILAGVAFPEESFIRDIAPHPLRDLERWMQRTWRRARDAWQVLRGRARAVAC